MGKVIRNAGAYWKKVTEHYGYIIETSYRGEPVYIVYEIINGVFGGMATCARYTCKDAEEACKYYEKITACRRKKK